MADINPGEIVRVSTRFKHPDFGDHVNVWHWRNDGASPVTQVDFIAACKAKMSAAWTFVASSFHVNLDPYDIRFDVAEFSGGKEIATKALGTDTWTLSAPPMQATDMLPSMDAALINFRSAQPGSFGRKYLGALVEGTNVNGTLQSAIMTQLGQFATEMLTALAAGGMSFNIGAISRKAGFAGTWIQFTAAVINSVIGTQRRRRRGVGG